MNGLLQEDKNGNDIQKEYNVIDGHWLNLHYKISVSLVLFVFFIELIISVIVVNSDLLHTTLPIYIIKYILVPSGLNMLCIVIETILLKIQWISQKYKMYIVSILFSVVCFVLFTVHNVFITTFFIFTVAIILTVVYANYLITIHTALLSLVLLICSELFITWDVNKTTIFESASRMSEFLIAIFTLIAFTIISMVIVKYEQRKNLVSIQIEKERKVLEHRIKMDELTGIFNRKALYDMLKEIDDMKDGHYILAIIDIDKFKEINDNLGHQTGDDCLINFARVLSENGNGAIPFRYAGDEFCLLFSNVLMEQAIDICEHIRLEIKQINIHPDYPLSASFGLSKYQEESGAAQLFVRADQALYKAKRVRDSIALN